MLRNPNLRFKDYYLRRFKKPMSSEVIFFYDGQCPFCNHFAELLEIKGSISGIQIKDARQHLPDLTALYKKGFDIDKGAILILKDEILQGASAINWVCKNIESPSNSLLGVLRVIFISKNRANFIFPFLIFARRVALVLKGISWRPVHKNLQFF